MRPKRTETSQRATTETEQKPAAKSASDAKPTYERRPRKLRVRKTFSLLWPDNTFRGGGGFVVWGDDPTIKGYEHVLEPVPDSEYDAATPGPFLNRKYAAIAKEAGFDPSRMEVPPDPPKPKTPTEEALDAASDDATGEFPTPDR